MDKIFVLFLCAVLTYSWVASQKIEKEKNAQQQREEQEQANQREEAEKEKQGEQQRRLEEVEERTKPTIDCRSAARARAAEIAQYQYSSDLIPGDPTERQIDDDHIELVAKDFKFQNGFGAWRYVPYRCIYNTRTKTVESVLFEE